MRTTRPEWVDDRLLPFPSHTVHVAGHTVHYLDEGHGPTLLLLHGNPTWSFLWRDVIRSLRSDFRCVAPDLPGFGLSRTASGEPLLPAAHAEVMAGLVDALALDRYTLVAHDWGGPIGLAVAGDRPGRVAGLVLACTWAWPTGRNLVATAFGRVAGSWPGGVAIRQANALVLAGIPAGRMRRRPSWAELRHYRAPLDTPAARQASHVLARELIDGQGFLRSVAARLAALEATPTLSIWAGRDPVFGAYERERFERILPRHTSVTIDDAGHLVAEDAPVEFAAAVRRWWSDTGDGDRDRPTVDVRG